MKARTDIRGRSASSPDPLRVEVAGFQLALPLSVLCSSCSRSGLSHLGKVTRSWPRNS